MPFTSGTYLYILYSTPRRRKEAIPFFSFQYFVCVCHAVYKRWKKKQQQKQKLQMRVAPWFKPQLVCSSRVELVERRFTKINCKFLLFCAQDIFLVTFLFLKRNAASKNWNKLKTPTLQGFYSRYFRYVLCLKTDSCRKTIGKTTRLSNTAYVGGCEKRLLIVIDLSDLQWCFSFASWADIGKSMRYYKGHVTKKMWHCFVTQ